MNLLGKFYFQKDWNVKDTNIKISKYYFYPSVIYQTHEIERNDCKDGIHLLGDCKLEIQI
jgi:hypothetical protein